MSYQAYLDSVKEKTGMSPDDFKVMAEQKGLLEPGVKAGTIVAWLKDDFGLGHGHAMAIYGTLKSASAPKESTHEAVAKHFAGAKTAWQPGYEQLVAKISEFGPRRERPSREVVHRFPSERQEVRHNPSNGPALRRRS